MNQHKINTTRVLPKKTSLQWSYSRREILQQCPRRYYYQYFGSSNRTAKDEPQKQKLRFLKGLSNRYLRTGDILHLIIRTYLKRLQVGEPWSLEQLLSWARDIYRRDIEYSRNYNAEAIAHGKYPPVLLLEFYYRQDNSDQLCVESGQRLITALTAFTTSTGLASFRAGVCYENAIIEKPSYWKDDHFAVKGKIDLAYRERDRVSIVDWKIGKGNSAEGSLQLMSYAMLAMSNFNCTQDNINLYRVHLGENTVEHFEVREADIIRTRGRILQDLERMQVLDHYGRSAVVEAFTPCGQPRICKLCTFQGICPKE